MHVDVVGVFVNPAMPLVLGKSESGGELFLNGLEKFWREFGLVLRPETDQQMIRFFFPTTGIHALHGLGLDDGQIVIVIGGASGAPTRKALLAVMPGVGNVAGQGSVIIVRGLVMNVLADHLILMAAAFSSRIPISTSFNRRFKVNLSPPAAMACLNRPPSLPRSARALMIS